MQMRIKSIRFQQTVLCLELMGGLGGYFFMAWLLRALGFVQRPENVTELNRVAIQLFIPYLGIAVGGIFGATKLGDREVDTYTFSIAAFTALLWDLLAIGNLALVIVGSQVEDVVQFSENIMPVISTILAASIAYYFGAQTRAPGATTGDFKLKPSA